MPDFAYRILPPRADFAATLTDAEAALLRRHFDYLTRLNGEGRLSFVGRTENGDWGLCVFQAKDLAEADRIARADPVVAEGLMQVEVHHFRIVDFG